MCCGVENLSESGYDGVFDSASVNKANLLKMGRLKIVIPSQQRWRGYSNVAVRGWFGE